MTQVAQPWIIFLGKTKFKVSLQLGFFCSLFFKQHQNERPIWIRFMKDLIFTYLTAQSSLAHSSRSIPYSQHFTWNSARSSAHHDSLQAKPSPQAQRCSSPPTRATAKAAWWTGSTPVWTWLLTTSTLTRGRSWDVGHRELLCKT